MLITCSSNWWTDLVLTPGPIDTALWQRWILPLNHCGDVSYLMMQDWRGCESYQTLIDQTELQAPELLKTVLLMLLYEVICEVTDLCGNLFRGHRLLDKVGSVLSPLRIT
jgi:hypothetical protein